MYSISSLLEKRPALSEVQVVSSGFVLWVVCPESLPDVVRRTFPNFGGWPVVEEANQSLWFFFSTQVFFALARLHKWSQVNDLRLFVQALPGKVLIAPDLTKSITIPNDYAEQRADAPEKLDILIPLALEEIILTMQGLSLTPVGAWPGLAKVSWKKLQVNPSFAYQSNLQWVFALKPQGVAGDRDFSEGWRNFLAHVKKILSKQELRFLVTDDYHLLVLLTTLSQLKSWCYELLLALDYLRKEEKNSLWPVVIVGVQKGNMDFTQDVPNKLGLDWNQFEPGVPHLPLFDAYLLGKEFELTPAKVVQEQGKIKGHVKLALPSSSQGKAVENLFLPLPQVLLSGARKRCFYCGLKDHSPAVCPTKKLVQWPSHLWEKFAELSVKDIEQEFSKLDKNESLQSEKLNTLTKLLQEGEQKQLVLQCSFAICAPLQLRAVRMVWRSRGKDWPEGLRQLTDMEGEYIWSALENLRSNEVSASKKQGKQALLRYPRTFQPRTLLGLIAMEQNEIKSALSYWKEAEKFCYTPLQKSFHLVLRGRLQEINREYDAAISSYQEAIKISPRFMEARYRQGVCFIKSGFVDQGLGLFSELFENDMHLFNYMLIDPELERGHAYLLGNIGELWRYVLRRSQEEGEKLVALEKKVNEWIQSDKFKNEQFSVRIEQLKKFHKVKNFVAAKKLIQGVPSLADDFDKKVNQEVHALKKQSLSNMVLLQSIEEEAGWFPFPRLLRGFNNDFNYCVQKINEINQTSLFEGEKFKQAQEKMQEVEERIKKLKKRLTSLNLVRDAAVYFMYVGKGFLWLEAIGLFLAMVGVPLILLVGLQIDQPWASVFWDQRWRFQKIALLGLSTGAMIIAAIRASWDFERKKREFLESKKK
jgi:tetratricopeptide (TPR) repeat protein